MNRLLVSHTDLDGVSPVIISLLFKLPIDYFLLVDYGWEADPSLRAFVSGYQEIVFVDMRIPESFFKELKDQGKDIKIYDHHLPSQWIENKEGCVWDKNRCGTKIFWEEYIKPQLNSYPPVVETFVNMVNTYDLWLENSSLWTEAVKLNTVFSESQKFVESSNLGTLDFNIDFIRSCYHKLVDYPNYWVWTEEDKRLINEARGKEEELINNAENEMQIRVDNKGRKFGIFNLKEKASIVCNYILKHYPDLDYVISIKNTDTGELSLRSKSLNLNDLAGVHGHQKAAGGKVDSELAKKLMNDNYIPLYIDEIDSSSSNSSTDFIVFILQKHYIS